MLNLSLSSNMWCYIFYSIPLCYAISFNQFQYVMLFLSLNANKWWFFFHSIQSVIIFLSLNIPLSETISNKYWPEYLRVAVVKLKKNYMTVYTLKRCFLNNQNFFNNAMYKYINKMQWHKFKKLIYVTSFIAWPISKHSWFSDSC